MKNIDTLTDPVMPEATTPAPIDTTLADRQKTHGDFRDHARTTQCLKAVMQTAPRWDELTPMEREALDMVAHKLGRILCGDPSFRDHWHDILGYVRLVERELA